MSSPKLKAFSADSPVPTKPTKQVSWGLEQMNLLNSRFSTKADKGKLRPEVKDLESIIRDCLNRLNQGLANTSNCGQLAHTLAEFWASFVLVIQPYSDSNERIAKFFCVKSLNQFGLALVNPWLMEEFQTHRDLAKDVELLSKAILENLKLFDPSLE